MRAVPSLIIDSPSTSSRTRSGPPMRRKMAIAATASVGARMAPRTAASAQPRPGTVAGGAAAPPAAGEKEEGDRERGQRPHHRAQLARRGAPAGGEDQWR